MGVLAAAGIAAAGSVAAAGVSAYGASQQSKAMRSGNEIGQMPLGQYKDQLKAMSKAQFEYNSKMAQKNLDLYPAFAAVQLQGQKDAARAALGFYPKFTKAERLATSQQRAGDLSDLGKYGAGYAHLLGDLSPSYKTLDSLSNTLNENLIDQKDLLAKINREALAAGHSQIRDTLDKQALDELALGRSVSGEQERAAHQAARAAWSARGLAHSNGAVGAEILNRDAVASERERMRRAFAAGQWQLGDTEDLHNRQFMLDAVREQNSTTGTQVQQGIALANAKLAPIMGFMSQRTNLNPLALLGHFTPPDIGAPARVMSAAPQVGAMSGALGPMYGYMGDVNNTNFNAAESRGINTMNAYASAGSGLAQSLGQIGSSYYSNRPVSYSGGGGGYAGGGISGYAK